MTGKLLTDVTTAFALSLLVVGCGAQTSGTEDPNNGGRTHWLQSCDEDAECGSLDCLSNICTRTCSDASECNDLAPDAECGGKAGAAVCLEACAGDECTPSAPYDPCAGKACGEDCRLCAPNDVTCDETAEPKNCNLEGRCDDSFDDALCDEPDASPAPSDVLSCEELTAPSPANPVEVTVRNDRDVALLLDSPMGCAGSVYLGVVSLDESSPGDWYAGGNCFFGCDRVLTERTNPCPPACHPTQPIVVRPGESVQLEWVGALTETVDAPLECCTLGGDCPDTCSLVRVAQPGRYLATLAVAELTQAEADDCEQMQSTSCLPGSHVTSPVELEFQLGVQPIVLMVP